MKNMLLSACCLLAGPAALAATMASQSWVSSRISEAVAEFARTNAVLKAGPYVKRDSTTPSGQTLGGGFRVKGWISSTGTVSVVRDGPSLLEVRKPQTWMDFDCFGLGWGTGGWVFDKDGFHRQFQGFPMGPWVLGPAFSFPEDAYETGGVLALRSDIPDVSGFATAEYADSAASAAVEPVSNLVETVRAESALVYRLYQGSNMVVEVTNYNSSVHAPELRLMQLNESNEYVTVWAETNGLARTLKRANEYTDDATGAVARAAAPRAWSRTTSGLGEEAPPNTTWISTEKLVIASGQEYVSVDSAGVWVLCANGQVDFTTKTNSYFSISTETGEPVFSVERSDSRPIPVYSGGIRVDDSGGSIVVTIPVPVFDATENRNDPPFLSVSTDLSGPWYSETNSIPSSLVTSCTWSGQNGAWTNTVVMAPSHPVAFFSYAKWQAGGMVIRNKASMEVSQGIIVNGQKFVPIVNGSTLTWQAQ